MGFAAERIEVAPGKKVDLKLQLQRLAKDFTGKVTILPLAPPPSLAPANAEIAAGATEATLTVQVAGNMQPGEYTLTVLGQGQVPYAKDAKMAKTNVLVSLPARPVTVVVPAKK